MYIEFDVDNTGIFSVTDSKQDQWIIGGPCSVVKKILACPSTHDGPMPRSQVKSVRTPTSYIAYL